MLKIDGFAWNVRCWLGWDANRLCSPANSPATQTASSKVLVCSFGILVGIASFLWVPVLDILISQLHISKRWRVGIAEPRFHGSGWPGMMSRTQTVQSWPGYTEFAIWLYTVYMTSSVANINFLSWFNLGTPDVSFMQGVSIKQKVFVNWTKQHWGWGLTNNRPFAPSQQATNQSTFSCPDEFIVGILSCYESLLIGVGWFVGWIPSTLELWKSFVFNQRISPKGAMKTNRRFPRDSDQRLCFRWCPCSSVTRKHPGGVTNRNCLARKWYIPWYTNPGLPMKIGDF